MCIRDSRDRSDVDVGGVRKDPQAVLRLELVDEVDTVLAARQRDEAVVRSSAAALLERLFEVCLPGVALVLATPGCPRVVLAAQAADVTRVQFSPRYCLGKQAIAA